MIRNKVKEYFKSIDLSIMEAHRRTGIARTTITRMVNNEIVNINMDTVDTICKTFGCTFDDLFDYIPDEQMTKADKKAVADRIASVKHYSSMRRRNAKTGGDV